MVIVLETSGKHESVDYATVRVFDTLEEANDYCHGVATGLVKYWTEAIVVQNGEKIELSQPESAL